MEIKINPVADIKWLNQISQQTINDICNLVKPLTPVYDKNGILFNNIYIVLECPYMHIHNYYTTDVYKKNIKCITCSSGNKFTIMVRNLLEHTFKIPFVVANKVHQNSKIEYINHQLALQIICCQNSIIQKPYICNTNYNNSDNNHNNILYVFVYPTTSLKRLSIQLYNQLKNYYSHFKPNILSQIQHLNIYINTPVYINTNLVENAFNIIL